MVRHLKDRMLTRTAVPDIFDEVEEDLRAERMRKLLRQYGGLLVVGAVLVVVGVGAWEAWTQYRAREATRQAETFLAAQKLADGPQGGRAAALPTLTSLAADGSAGYRTLSRLRAAALEADAGHVPAALDLWNQVANDGSADPMLRDLANLQWALHQIDSGDPSLVSARLAPLTVPTNPWHALADEGTALLAMRQGQMDLAKETLRKLAEDTTAPDGVRGRANGLLQRIGGGA